MNICQSKTPQSHKTKNNIPRKAHNLHTKQQTPQNNKYIIHENKKQYKANNKAKHKHEKGCNKTQTK